MNSFEQVVAVGLLGALVLATSAFAQSSNTSIVQPATRDRYGQVVVPEKPTVADVQAVDNVLRPDRLERPELPAEVLTRIEIFKLKARAFLEKQQELKKQLQGANDTERARIRLRLEQLRQEWLSDAKELRTEAKDRRGELLKKLPTHRELLGDPARDELRDQLKEQQRELRDRRGTD